MMRAVMIGTTLALIAAPANAQGSFCERLAAQTGMTAERAKAGQPPSLWSIRTLNLAQRFLVGGQAMVTMQLASGPHPEPGDYARLSEACKTVGKTLGCTIEGPAELRIGVNGKEARLLAEAGEKARVEMAGTRLTCSNGAGGAQAARS